MMRRSANIAIKPMNPDKVLVVGKVLVVVAGALLFFLAIRILFNPRPVVYILSFPYGVIAGSAASRKLWMRLKTRLHLPKRKRQRCGSALAARSSSPAKRHCSA